MIKKLNQVQLPKSSILMPIQQFDLIHLHLGKQPKVERALEVFEFFITEQYCPSIKLTRRLFMLVLEDGAYSPINLIRLTMIYDYYLDCHGSIIFKGLFEEQTGKSNTKNPQITFTTYLNQILDLQLQYIGNWNWFSSFDKLLDLFLIFLELDFKTRENSRDQEEEDSKSGEVFMNLTQIKDKKSCIYVVEQFSIMFEKQIKKCNNWTLYPAKFFSLVLMIWGLSMQLDLIPLKIFVDYIANTVTLFDYNVRIEFYNNLDKSVQLYVLDKVLCTICYNEKTQLYKMKPSLDKLANMHTYGIIYDTTVKRGVVSKTGQITKKSLGFYVDLIIMYVNATVYLGETEFQEKKLEAWVDKIEDLLNQLDKGKSLYLTRDSLIRFKEWLASTL